MWQQLAAYYWAVDYCSVSSAHGWPPKNICRFNGTDRSVPLFLRGRCQTQLRHKAKLKNLLKFIINDKAKKSNNLSFSPKPHMPE